MAPSIVPRSIYLYCSNVYIYTNFHKLWNEKKRKKERKRIDGCGELLKLVFAFNKVPRRTGSALRIGLEIRYFQLSKLGLVIRINPRRNEPRQFADQ